MVKSTSPKVIQTILKKEFSDIKKSKIETFGFDRK
jgi:hypothetical protein